MQSPSAPCLSLRARLGALAGLAIALALLGALSRGLDRPATLAGLAVDVTAGITREDDQVLPGPAVRARVWATAPAAPAGAWISFGALPGHAALALAAGGA